MGGRGKCRRRDKAVVENAALVEEQERERAIHPLITLLTGPDVWFLHHALPGVQIEDASGFADRAAAGLPVIFERAVIIDRCTLTLRSRVAVQLGTHLRQASWILDQVWKADPQ